MAAASEEDIGPSTVVACRLAVPVEATQRLASPEAVAYRLAVLEAAACTLVVQEVAACRQVRLGQVQAAQL